MNANIIPQPSYIQEKQGISNLAYNNNTLYTGKHPEVNQIIDNFVEQVLGDYGLRLQTNKPKKTDILLQDRKSLNEEAYELSVVANKVVIKISAPAGFFYALHTVNQLILVGKNHTLFPCTLVKDAPRFFYRRFLTDAGRYYLPLKDVKKAINLAVNHKLNRFRWHPTDDQGWWLEMKKYPRLTEKGSVRSNSAIGTWNQYRPCHYDGEEHSGYCTQDEIHDIMRYATDRQIITVPEIETPGHALVVLSVYPEYACSSCSSLGLMAGADISDQAYCPKSQTFRLIKDTLVEITNLFPGEYIYTGGDERPKTSWRQCEDCRALIRKEDLKGKFELHAYFTQQVEKIAEGLGRKLIGWDEVLEGGFPLKAAVMSWRGKAGGIRAAQLSNNVIITPNTYCYLGHHQENLGFTPLAIGGFISLEQAYDYEPIPEALTVEEAKHTIGTRGNIWGEYIAIIEKFEYTAFPRLPATAGVAWSQSRNKSQELFISYLKKELSSFQKRSVNTCCEYFRPRIQGGQGSEKEVYAATFETICLDADIRYTLDGLGSTVESDIYEGPAYLTENTYVGTVVTDKDNQILGAPTVGNFLMNKAARCTYTLSTDAWSLDWYPVKPTLSTDGVQGSTPLNYEWAAIAPGVETVIDLRKNTTVPRVHFGAMVVPISSTLPAKPMICYLSRNGKEFRQIGGDTFLYPIYKGEKEIYHNYVETEKGDGRYLKFMINGQTELPEDYPYSNVLPSIVLDEIEVF